MVGIAPLVLLDELEDIVDIKSLLKLDLVLFLHLSNDAN